MGQGVHSGESGDLLTLILTFVLPTMTLMMKRVCSVAGGQVLAEGGGNGRQEVPQAYSTLAVDDDGDVDDHDDGDDDGDDDYGEEGDEKSTLAIVGDDNEDDEEEEEEKTDYPK